MMLLAIKAALDAIVLTRQRLAFDEPGTYEARAELVWPVGSADFASGEVFCVLTPTLQDVPPPDPAAYPAD